MIKTVMMKQEIDRQHLQLMHSLGYKNPSEVGTGQHCLIYHSLDRVLKFPLPANLATLDEHPVTYKYRIQHIVNKAKALELVNGVHGIVRSFNLYYFQDSVPVVVSPDKFQNCKNDVVLEKIYIPGERLTIGEPITDTARIVLSQAISSCHQAGFSGIDVVPENIINNEGMLWLIDLGTAEFMDDHERFSFGKIADLENLAALLEGKDPPYYFE